jgi:hypothetical protein
MSVFESIKRECFPSPRGWVMGHCSVGDAGRDTYAVTAVYPKACAVKLLNSMRIFPVFYNFLLRPAQMLALSKLAASAWGTSVSSARQVYAVVIRSVLAYAAPNWHDMRGGLKKLSRTLTPV